MPAVRRNAQYKSLHEAVKNGDIQELELMVKEGASVNSVDDTKDRFTPLHWASHKGALECLHWLLWHGADMTVTSPQGWTPAHIAAIRGQDACLQALTNNGANMNAKDNRGCTTAHLAASHGNSFALHSLLRAGVDLSVLDVNGWNAVHYAAFHGRLGCLQLLIRWGGGFDEADNAGNTPAHLAAMEGQLACLKFLIGEASSADHVLGARNDDGDTPLTLAQRFFKDQVVDYITNVEWEKQHPEEAENLAFPAHVAAYTGDLEHLKMLIDNGIVNIDERDDKGSTLVHKAAGQGHLHVLRWLIESGANTNIENQAGETARDVARRFAHLGALRLLGESDELNHDVDNEEDEDAEREGMPLGKDEQRSAKERARNKVIELDRQLEIARKNLHQLGGRMPGDDKREAEHRERERAMAELESQLQYERIRRDKLEAKVDEYRQKIAVLESRLEEYELELMHKSGGDRLTKTRKKKTGTKKGLPREGGVFVRRTGGHKSPTRKAVV